MIICKIEHIGRYAALHPRFALVDDFLRSHDLSTMPLGHYEIEGKNLFVNIMEVMPKSRHEARLETHNEMIDIQILLQGKEQHGFAPRDTLCDTFYDKANDISFYDESYDNVMTILPGYAVIYFPEDAHAPAICEQRIRKAIFKVKQ